MVYYARVYKTGEKIEKQVVPTIGRGRHPLGWNKYFEDESGNVFWMGYFSFFGYQKWVKSKRTWSEWIESYKNNWEWDS